MSKQKQTAMSDGWAARAREQGWRVAVSHDGVKLRFYPPTGPIITTSRMVSANNSGARNARAMLRKAGLDI